MTATIGASTWGLQRLLANISGSTTTGNNEVKAIYDARINVSSSVNGTLVGSWGDARYNAGTPLTSSGAQLPTYNAQIGIVSGTVGSAMATVSSNLFNFATGYSLVYIGAIPQTGTGAQSASPTLVSVGDVNAGASDVEIYVQHFTPYTVTFEGGLGGSVDLTSTLIGINDHRRLVYGMYSPSIPEVYGVTPVSIPTISGSCTAMGAGANALGLFTYGAGTTLNIPVATRLVAWISHPLTTAEQAALLQYANASHGTQNT